VSTNVWTSAGPACVYNGQLTGRGSAAVSGRCTAIVVDQTNTSIVYVGTATGGIWRSEDQGRNWKPIMDDQLTLSVGAMMLDSSNPLRLYVATGEGNTAGETLPGVGLMIYTHNVGWELKGHAELDGTHITNIAIDTRPPGGYQIYLATNRGLKVSANDGGSWNELLVWGSLGMSVSDIAFNLGANPDSAIVYAALRGDGVYKKTGAAGFVRLARGGPTDLPNVANVDRISLTLCPGTPSTVYAVFASKTGEIIGLYRSDNDGVDWTALKRPAKDMRQGHYNLLLAAHPTDPKTIFFGETRLWRSIDGGQDWDEVSDSKGDSPGIHPDQHALAFGPQVDPKTPRHVWAGNDGGVWISFDGGESFFSRNRGLQTFQYYSLAQHADEPNLLLAGSQDNGVQRYEGQPAWTLTASGDGFYCAIDPVEKNRWYSSYVFLQDDKIKAIQRSEKTGKPGSWDYVVSHIRNTFAKDKEPFYVPFVMDPKDNKTLYLGSDRLWITKNYGDEWTAVRPAVDQEVWTTGDNNGMVITAIGVNPDDNTMIYVGTYDGRVFLLAKQSDFIYTVTPLPGLPAGAYIADIAVPPAGGGPATKKAYVALGMPESYYAVVGNFPTGRIWLTDVVGGTRTWTSLYKAQLDIDFTPTIKVLHANNPVNAISIDPANPQTVYIGCNTGLFRTTDAGATWAAYNQGLPNVTIADLQFHGKKRLLRAATMGRGVWERSVDVAAPGPKVDLYIRDNFVDSGRDPTPKSTPDPLSPGDTLTWTSGADVKIDTPFLGIGSFATPASTVDYSATGDADIVAFPQFGSDNFRKSVTSRVYAQVMNRGPEKATAVKVRAWYTAKVGAGYPDLPKTFWSTFPNDGNTDPWVSFGAAYTLAELAPGLACVAKWEYKMPSAVGDPVGVLVVATCAEDPVNENSLVVEDIAKTNKHISLREVGVNVAAADIAIAILVVVGLAAVVTTVALATKK